MDPTAVPRPTVDSDVQIMNVPERQNDDAPADDGGDNDDGADVGQLTAIAQRVARDQRAQRGGV
eukprot:350659-Chlamydomonas_euryale.AAC.5